VTQHRWFETRTSTDDDGNIVKQLNGPAPPTEAEISKVEYEVTLSKKPFLLYWDDDELTDDTLTMLFFWGTERWIGTEIDSNEKRAGVQSVTMTYATATQQLAKMKQEKLS
jgi:hypothetical protein